MKQLKVDMLISCNYSDLLLYIRKSVLVVLLLFFTCLILVFQEKLNGCRFKFYCARLLVLPHNIWTNILYHLHITHVGAAQPLKSTSNKFCADCICRK